MKTIAVMNQKGGAGKTTLTVHIATAADLAGYPAAVIDIDQQGTAEIWGKWRKKQTGAQTPLVVGAKAATLDDWLATVKEHGAKLAVIDTPPFADASVTESARQSDLILMPCRPAAFDLHSMQLTATLAANAGKPAYVVFNSGPNRPNAKIYDECAAIVQRFGLAVAPVHLSERVAFAQAVGSGQTAQEIDAESKAAAEVAALWAWLKTTLKIK